MAQALLPDSVFDNVQSQQSNQQVLLPDSVFDAQATSTQNAQPQQGFFTQLKHSLIDSARDANQVSADIFGGILNGAQNVVNTPFSLAHLFNKNINPSPYNHDWAATFGAENQTGADKFVQGAASFLPFALGGEAALPADAGMLMKGANLAGAGAAYGLTQTPNNPIGGAGYGALGNLAGGAIGGGLGLAGTALKNYLSKFAAKGIANSLDENLSPIKNITNAQAFDLARNNYGNYTDSEKNAWDNLTAEGAIADEGGAKFDNSNYINALNNQLDVLKSQSGRQTPYARANADSQDLLNGYLNDEHSTFIDAIEHNKALNQDYQNEITPGKSLPFSTVNFAKDNIKKTISDNLKSNDLQDSLGQAWDDANNATQQKNQIFNTVASPKGREQFSTFSQLVKSNNPYQDSSTFVNEYVPTSRGDGTQKMQQFAQMLGNDDAAKNVIKMNYFDSAFNKNADAVNPQQFLTRYNNLSPEQQSYLFSPEEQQTLTALNKIAAKTPYVLKSGAAIGGGNLMALLGGIAGHNAGPGAVLGALGGWATNKAVNSGLNALMSSSPMTNYFIKQLANPSQSSRAILPLLAKSALSSATVQGGAQ